jgi:hypothetical protein
MVHLAAAHTNSTPRRWLAHVLKEQVEQAALENIYLLAAFPTCVQFSPGRKLINTAHMETAICDLCSGADMQVCASHTCSL